MNRSDLKLRLKKLTKEGLVDRLADWEMRGHAAEEYFLFGPHGQSKGRKGDRAVEALYLVLPTLIGTKAAGSDVQVFWDVTRARASGKTRKDAIEYAARRNGVALQSATRMYQREKRARDQARPRGDRA